MSGTLMSWSCSFLTQWTKWTSGPWFWYHVWISKLYPLVVRQPVRWRLSIVSTSSGRQTLNAYRVSKRLSGSHCQTTIKFMEKNKMSPAISNRQNWSLAFQTYIIVTRDHGRNLKIASRPLAFPRTTPEPVADRNYNSKKQENENGGSLHAHASREGDTDRKVEIMGVCVS